MDLEGSDTHKNLLAAFSNESQSSRRYHWFADQADVEGRPEAAALFRTIGAVDAGHANGHLEYLAEIGDPLSGHPIGDVDDNWRTAMMTETSESMSMFKQFAASAQREGFDEIAEWFESMASSQGDHIDRLRAMFGNEQAPSTP